MRGIDKRVDLQSEASDMEQQLAELGARAQALQKIAAERLDQEDRVLKDRLPDVLLADKAPEWVPSDDYANLDEPGTLIWGLYSYLDELKADIDQARATAATLARLDLNQVLREWAERPQPPAEVEQVFEEAIAAVPGEPGPAVLLVAGRFLENQFTPEYKAAACRVFERTVGEVGLEAALQHTCLMVLGGWASSPPEIGGDPC